MTFVHATWHFILHTVWWYICLLLPLFQTVTRNKISRAGVKIIKMHCVSNSCCEQLVFCVVCWTEGRHQNPRTICWQIARCYESEQSQTAFLYQSSRNTVTHFYHYSTRKLFLWKLIALLVSTCDFQRALNYRRNNIIFSYQKREKAVLVHDLTHLAF